MVIKTWIRLHNTAFLASFKMLNKVKAMQNNPSFEIRYRVLWFSGFGPALFFFIFFRYGSPGSVTKEYKVITTYEVLYLVCNRYKVNLEHSQLF
jgi:hypothetical protein